MRSSQELFLLHKMEVSNFVSEFLKNFEIDFANNLTLKITRIIKEDPLPQSIYLLIGLLRPFPTILGKKKMWERRLSLKVFAPLNLWKWTDKRTRNGQIIFSARNRRYQLFFFWYFMVFSMVLVLRSIKISLKDCLRVLKVFIEHL